MFGSILIANRGEIACRIIAACRALGVRAVAVYSEADAAARHVRLADAAVCIGPAPARESYLRAEAIVAAAKAAGAEAVHPGYGFLSEKIELAEACAAAGLVFIGPHVEALHAMGDKIRSRRIAESVGVPGVPGFDGEQQSDKILIARAQEIGLPVMVKASAGGGGKGIRPVHDASALKAAIQAARAEAEAAFGDGRLLIEKLVQRPRHVEVQVVGDKHGNRLHLFERDCSIQRANQKVLEEAPAPNLSDATRAVLHARALKLAEAISYDSVGTVEFLVEADTEEVFFLEMNTRLQVEHPVTEAVTGIDLVQTQIRIAAGEPLAFRQEDLRVAGHAIEARLTAERADKGFLPDVGTIGAWRAPAGARVDTGVEAGDQVQPHYDSLLAKVIAHGATRDDARRRLVAALDDLTALGVSTNRAFLRDAAAHPIFAAGRATTRFIGEAFPDGWAWPEDWRAAARAAAVAAFAQSFAGGPWGGFSGFRVTRPAGRAALSFFVLEDEAGREEISLQHETDGFHAGGYRILRRGSRLALLREGAEWPIEAAFSGVDAHVRVGPMELRARIEIASEAALSAAHTGAAGALAADMPGTIVALPVRVGDRVAAGETVAVIESMKLMIEIKSPRAGVVTAIAGAVGETAQKGQALVSIEPDAAEG